MQTLLEGSHENNFNFWRKVGMVNVRIGLFSKANLEPKMDCM
jgi:hypothetical protein